MSSFDHSVVSEQACIWSRLVSRADRSFPLPSSCTQVWSLFLLAVGARHSTCWGSLGLTYTIFIIDKSRESRKWIIAKRQLKGHKKGPPSEWKACHMFNLSHVVSRNLRTLELDVVLDVDARHCPLPGSTCGLMEIKETLSFVGGYTPTP